MSAETQNAWVDSVQPVQSKSSLTLEDLNKIQDLAKKELENFFSDKGTSNAKTWNQRKVLINRFLENPEAGWGIICENYGFRLNRRFKRREHGVIEVDLSPTLQALSVASGEFKFNNSKGFRNVHSLQIGMIGEVALSFFMSCLLHYFNLKYDTLRFLDKNNLAYSGDGGHDLRVGSLYIDNKHCDDNPSKGMKLTNSFVRSSMRCDEVLLTQTSNVTDKTKLGFSLVKKSYKEILSSNEYLPMAIVGCITFKDYENRKIPLQGGYSDWVVDDLDKPIDLAVKILTSANDHQGLFFDLTEE